MSDVDKILARLKKLRRKSDGTIYTPDIRAIAAEYRDNHKLALQLWRTGDPVARELAVNMADTAQVTEALLENWVAGIEEWGLCDGFTARLVRYSPFAVKKAHEWAERDALYIRRAGFATMAQMAWQANDYKDDVFIKFLPLIEKHAVDDRLHVKKAVNWALRDIGKRNPALAKKAMALAVRLQKHENKTARWVGRHRIGEI